MTYQIFKKALIWNSLNVIAYKIILQIHQIFLFYYISKELFGISGILFSSIYLLINVTNFGFDYSLFAFYRFFTRSKDNFAYLKHHCITRCTLVLLITIFLLFLFKHFSYLPQISFIAQFVSVPLLITLTSIFITENLKKTLEIFAHLSFLNRAITVVDISMLLIYVLIVWSCLAIQGFINLYTIFIPMALISWLELILIFKRLYNFYKTLPDTSAHESIPTTAALYTNQIINYINQIAKAFFSPNFIIIFIGYHLGMIQAGYVKLIIDSIILIYMLLNKAVGIPSAALMSQASGMQQSLQPEFKSIFLKISNTYIQFLYALALIFIFITGNFFIQAPCTSQPLLLIVLLFTLAGFLEYLVILYEKLFLTKHQEHVLAFINIASMSLLLLTLPHTWHLPPSMILLPFVLIRFISIVIIIKFVQKIWLLTPAFGLKLKTLLISILTGAFLFSVCFIIQTSL